LPGLWGHQYRDYLESRSHGSWPEVGICASWLGWFTVRRGQTR
jgi:hypothetical protein